MSFTSLNSSTHDLPPLPSYTLVPRPSLVPGVPDNVLQPILLFVTYWAASLFFHALDVFEVFPQYRLHTPAEVLKRNHVTRYEVLRDVIVQQFVQTTFALGLAYFDAPDMMGKEDYDIAMWAQRIRLAQRYVPKAAAIVGVNSIQWAGRLQRTYPTFASVLLGGYYPTSGFAMWEMLAAKFVYYIGVQAVQFAVAIFFVDTWQYFLHRGMHMNKFLYNWLHSRHHRLYVPYAYGALYNHPIEGFMLDTLGSGLAFLVTRMTTRQGMVLFNCSTLKTIDDHCGYAFPFDPLQHFTHNNAAYHDVHHQSWGVKANFSQPFSTFWDRVLGTTWSGGDVSARYERQKLAAQRKVDRENASTINSASLDVAKAKDQAEASQEQVIRDSDHNGVQAIKQERQEEQEAARVVSRSSRRSGSFDPKAFSDRVAGSLHGRSAAILHADN